MNRGEKIGPLDRRISVEEPTVTKGSTGQEVVTWSLFVELWANRIDGGGKEAVDAGRETDFSKVIFTIRHIDGITQKMRVICNNVEHDIIQINEIGRKNRIELITESRE